MYQASLKFILDLVFATGKKHSAFQLFILAGPLHFGAGQNNEFHNSELRLQRMLEQQLSK